MWWRDVTGDPAFRRDDPALETFFLLLHRHDTTPLTRGQSESESRRREIGMAQGFPALLPTPSLWTAFASPIGPTFSKTAPQLPLAITASPRRRTTINCTTIRSPIRSSVLLVWNLVSYCRECNPRRETPWCGAYSNLGECLSSRFQFVFWVFDVICVGLLV